MSKIDEDLINGFRQNNAIDGLKELPDNSVHFIMFSPPYFRLRDYSDESNMIWDEDDNCDHEWDTFIRKGISGGKKSSKVKVKGKDNFQIVEDKEQAFCSKCEAWKGQLGQESDVNMYVKHMKQIGKEVYRVLRKDGSFWLNIGDTFAQKDIGNYSRKSLLQVPSRVSIGLIEEGFVLRDKVVWNKPNSMPTSIKDRLNNVYEMLFHFTKSDMYYFDLDSIRIEHQTKGDRRADNESYHPLGKNPGDVWSIPTQKYKDAHFAVYPKELVERPIKSTCPERVCSECGEPLIPIIEDQKRYFEKRCDCEGEKYEPGIVLDPMCGSGTTNLVAQELNRRWMGYDINNDYLEMARERMKKNASEKIDSFF